MFSKTIDYYLLKPLTHRRNLATEAELNERAKKSNFSLEKAHAYFDRAQSLFFRNQLPINSEMSYLDIGCGMGRLSIGLSLAGAINVTGIDIVERNIDKARRIALGIEANQRPKFFCSDIHDWKPDHKYDVIIVLGAMEHVHDSFDFLKILAKLLTPDGLAFVSHEPFQSPTGDHMQGFFNIRIPWRGLLFSEEAILRLRSECYRPTDGAKNYQDIVGGLNLMSYSQYLKRARDAGLTFVFHNCNPQIQNKRYRWLLCPISFVLTHIPKLRDYFIVSVYSIMRLR